MFEEMSFEDWYAKVKPAFAAAGLTLPEDIELMELAHMECMNDGKSIEQFVEEEVVNQKR